MQCQMRIRRIKKLMRSAALEGKTDVHGMGVSGNILQIRNGFAIKGGQ